MIGKDSDETTVLTIDGGHSLLKITAILDGLVTNKEFNLNIGSEWGPFAKATTIVTNGESKVVTKATIGFQQSTSRYDKNCRVFEWTVHNPDVGDHYLIDIK